MNKNKKFQIDVVRVFKLKKGLNTLLVLRVSNFYFFLPKIWKVTKLVIVVLKSDQINHSIS
jgi:hypothetical protein